MTKISADKHSIKKGDGVNVSWSSALSMLMSREKIGEMIDEATMPFKELMAYYKCAMMQNFRWQFTPPLSIDQSGNPSQDYTY